MSFAKLNAPGFTGGRFQDGLTAVVINQKETGVIEIEAFLNEIHGAFQQLVQFQNAGGDGGDFGGRLQLGTLGGLCLQGFLHRCKLQVGV